LLVAPYGSVGWVHNVRASGTATLSRHGKSEDIRPVEASVEEAAPVLIRYLEMEKIVRPYFDVSPDSPLEDIVAVAHGHPVFWIDG
jgi:hypothetical protein